MSENRTITVTGRGDIHVVPDVTRLEVTVFNVFKTYNDAYDRARENSAWMVKILEYNNKSGKLAKTTRFDISDNLINEYDDDGNYIGKIQDGYTLTQVIKIDLPIDNTLVNKIVRGIGKFIAGAQINIGYTIQDPRPYRLKMLARAVSDSRDKAQIMAEAAGCKLGAAQDIYYNNDMTHVYSQARNIHSNKEAMACSSESLDITPDDLVMGDDVRVVWALE